MEGGWVAALAYWRDDKFFSSSQDGSVRLWRISQNTDIHWRSRGIRQTFPAMAEQWTWKCELVAMGWAGSWARSLAVCGHVLLGGSKNGTVRVWDVGEEGFGRDEAGIEQAWGETACVSRLASLGGNLERGISEQQPMGSMPIWKCATVLQGHTCGVNAVVVCGDHVVTASGDKTIRLWGAGEVWGQATAGAARTSAGGSVMFSPGGNGATRAASEVVSGPRSGVYVASDGERLHSAAVLDAGEWAHNEERLRHRRRRHRHRHRRRAIECCQKCCFCKRLIRRCLRFLGCPRACLRFLDNPCLLG